MNELVRTPDITEWGKAAKAAKLDMGLGLKEIMNSSIDKR